ncbi:MAG: tRNA (guanosine(37)-N1)-methyltransferase TrmD [Coprococcus sp.]
MNFYVLTLFPDMVMNGLKTSITGRAMEAGLLHIEAINIRDFTNDKHGHVDDYPYGGGAGMVMQAEPVYKAYMHVCEQIGHKPIVIYMTPQGRVFNQKIAGELAELNDIVLLCGHYEGIDERVLDMIVDEYMSIGDFVLTGGELPAMAIIDAVSRLVPGVLNNDDSAEIETFHDNLLEYPQYTRPASFMGMDVPEVLLSGHHKNIEAWRLEQSIMRTKDRRPDMYEKYKSEHPDTMRRKK